MSRSSRHSIDPLTVRFYHGRITREEAESRLRKAGCMQGLYLLRESLGKEGSYALSLCFEGKVYHYAIERQHGDGMVAIKDGKRFSGPVELVQHYETQEDGLLCRLREPCLLPQGVTPRSYSGMTQRIMDEEIIKLARSQGMSGDQIQKAMTPAHRSQFEKLMKSIMHKDMTWFHGVLSREEAEQRIIQSGLQEGKFLVRERTEPGSFALSLCFQNAVYHYKIDKDCTGQLSIKDGPKFDTLLMMVDHYEQKKDGLLCTLRVACSDPHRRRHSAFPGAPGKEIRPLRRIQSIDEEILPNRFPPSPPFHGYLGANSTHQPQLYPQLPAGAVGGADPPPLPVTGRPGNRQPAADDLLQRIVHTDWGDEPSDEPSPRRSNPLAPAAPPIDDNREYPRPNAQEEIYNQVAKSKQTKKLDIHNLDLAEPIGKGNFGSVLKGTYKMQGRLIPVAVKTLKTESGIPNSKPEIVKEAEIMAGLDHPHIVRMIGICEGSEMMLVLELAELGPLHKYLKRHTDMSIRNVLELMLQVAKGMQYLEEEANFVHRDLAARNVLLVDETFAKISDFGMSKALGLDSQYYVAETAGKWPLKWYAPECIYRFKFSSKSDVWSYGVTLWEALSYGKKPYANMKGQELMAYIEKDERLHKPERCPDEVYEMMRKCWLFSAQDRPSFRDIVRQMTDILSKLRSGTLRNYHWSK